MKAVGIQQGGPWLSEVQHRIMQWQLDHPKADADECLAWLKDEQAAGNIPLPSTGAEPPSKKPRMKK